MCSLYLSAKIIPHMMLTFTTGTTLTLVHSKWASGWWDAECAPLGQNDVLCRGCAQKGQKAPRCLLLIHTGLAFTTCNKTSSVLSPHTRKNNSINYVIITNFSTTVHLLEVTELVEVHYSVKYIHIQDSEFANKMGVNKDYRFFSCDAT